MEYLKGEFLHSDSCVYLVGAGPGDPGLITVRGREILQQADVVIYDYLANSELLWNVPCHCEKIYAGKKGRQHALPQDAINELLYQKALIHKTVVRLKGGDPYIFGRGSEEAIYLDERKIRVEVIPGIPAVIGAAAYAGIPLTDRRNHSCVTLITGHEKADQNKSRIQWKELARMQGTLVFYMGIGNLPNICHQLLNADMPPQTRVSIVEWATLSKQKTVCATLSTIVEAAEQKQIKPPALIMVSKNSEFRDQLNWFEKKPLFGKRIAVTRSRSQSADLVRPLTRLGAEVIELPVLRIAPPEHPEKVTEALHRMNEYNWCIFTSVNAVERFFSFMENENLDGRIFADTRIAVTGETTGKRLKEFGLIYDLIPEKYAWNHVLDAMKKSENLEGKRILLPRADIARKNLPEGLREAGALVDEVQVYRTVVEEQNRDEVRAIFKQGLDAITFTSSSTIRYLDQILGENILNNTLNSGTASIVIGPETSKTLKGMGLEPSAQAEVYTIPGLVEACLNYFTPHTETKS